MMRCFYFHMLKLGADHLAQKNVNDRLKKIMELVNDRLIQVPWLAGEEFTAADIMTVSSFTTMRLFYPMDLTGYDGILSWLERVGKRPAYRTAREKGDPGFAPLLGAEAPQLLPGL